MAVTHTLVRDDAVLTVRDWGGDRTPMVLIHGLAGNQREWDAAGVRLAREFRIITFDQRGHGTSSRSDDYSWSTRVDDLVALIEEMKLRDVTLVGHSVGAGVALEAANKIGGCRGVAMIDGALPVELPVPYGKAPGHPVRNFFITTRRAALHRIARSAPMSFAEFSRIGDDYRGRFAEFAEALRAVTCPALYILGSRVEHGPTGLALQAVREESAVVAVEANPLVRVQWIDARHNMIRTHPRQVAATLMLLHASAP
jgi:pimeloyl-ACP methyl ester carboxylesterase